MRWLMIGLSVVALSGCAHTRRPIRYGDPITMSAEEAAEIDRLVAEAQSLPPGDRPRCELWEGARDRLAAAMPGAARYAEAAAKNPCANDPAHAFRGTPNQRDAALAAATEGYEPTGEPTVVVAGEKVTLLFERGRCYRLTFRFDEGFEPSRRVDVDSKLFDTVSGGPVSVMGLERGPGPGAVKKLGCVFATQDAAVTLQADDGVKAELRVFSRRLSELETKRLEAKQRASMERAMAESQAYEARARREHCARCGSDLDACIGTSPESECLAEYESCLAEDRGDFVVTASECQSFSATAP